MNDPNGLAARAIGNAATQTVSYFGNFLADPDTARGVAEFGAGVSLMGLGVGGDIASGPSALALAPAAISTVAAGSALVLDAGQRLAGAASRASENVYYSEKSGANDVAKKVDYSSIKNPLDVGPGKDFSLRQKQEALELNRAANGGVVKSDLSGTELVKPQKSQRGVTPDPNEWQFDHITPKNCGGTNCSSNLQILSRRENRLKSDN